MKIFYSVESELHRGLSDCLPAIFGRLPCAEPSATPGGRPGRLPPHPLRASVRADLGRRLHPVARFLPNPPPRFYPALSARRKFPRTRHKAVCPPHAAFRSFERGDERAPPIQTRHTTRKQHCFLTTILYTTCQGLLSSCHAKLRNNLI